MRGYGLVALRQLVPSLDDDMGREAWVGTRGTELWNKSTRVQASSTVVGEWGAARIHGTTHGGSLLKEGGQALDSLGRGSLVCQSTGRVGDQVTGDVLQSRAHTATRQEASPRKKRWASRGMGIMTSGVQETRHNQILISRETVNWNGRRVCNFKLPAQPLPE